MALLPPGVHAEFPADHGQLTPLFKQYTAIKQEHPHALLLYRLGDFYEMFGPDAVRGAELLGLTLTSRACHKDYKVAMCGIPHHASVRYIKRLIQAGEIVAICDQTEDPAQAKGLVERGVTRVITAGTLVEDEYLAGDSTNFLAVAAERGGVWGVALLESSGGRVDLLQLPPGAAPRALFEAILRYRPAEILLPEAANSSEECALEKRNAPGPVYHAYSELPPERDVAYFLARYFEVADLEVFGIARLPALQAALFALVRYLKETFRVGAVRLFPRLTPLAGTLYLDPRTVGHLELLCGPDPGAGAVADGGLYGILNRCRTAGGRRELRRWLLAPLADVMAISARYDAVGYFVERKPAAESLGGLLGQVQDVERIVNRVGLSRTHPKEVRALAASLPPLADAAQMLRETGVARLAELAGEIGDFRVLYNDLERTLADDPPVKLSDGGVIRPGADARVDELRGLVHSGRGWLEAYQEAERERTGIRALKIKQTGPFGYFIEVSKASLALVPADYERKQTLVNAERFVTPELTEREREMQTAEARLAARERELFEALCARINAEAGRLAKAARAAAEADVLLSFAQCARELRWTRPTLEVAGQGGGPGGARLVIEGGRHPLVEQAVGERYYAPNDCYLSALEQQISIVTGPNMGGKSTYLRMVAVLAVLAQMGSFVPATGARLLLFSRIYTRVGAQDRLSRGQSTFMVEMIETAEILNTCGPDSLVLLDEVGRGTSTYDGISLAKAVVEYLHEHPARPLVLFATHFFELTDLEIMLPRVRNLQVEVAQEGGRFVFLYRVSPGAASESYGIEVAALAGLPEAVVERARAILAELEEAKSAARERARRAVQLGLFHKE